MSSKDISEKSTLHSKSDDIEIMIDNDINEILFYENV